MKHCMIRATDGQTAHQICQLKYDTLLTLIVWHRLQGDAKVFDQISEFAKRANESDLGHPCPECGAQLILLANDSEFTSLKHYSDRMKAEDIIK